MKLKILFAAALGVLCALPLIGAPESTADTKFKIQLQNRQFVPSPGIDPALRKTMENSEIFPINGIVQLFSIPSKSERASLLQAGVQLRQFLGETAYLAEFSQNAAFDRITNLVRWAGLLLAEDKTEKTLWQGKIENWAKADAGTIKVVAKFYQSTSSDESRKILSRYTKTFRHFGLNSEWAVEISHEKLKALAAEPSIRWLEQGPSSFRPLNSSPR